MDGLTYMEFQCNECENWFKKSMRKQHKEETGHFFSGRKRIVKSTQKHVNHAIPELTYVKVNKPIKTKRLLNSRKVLRDEFLKFIREGREADERLLAWIREKREIYKICDRFGGGLCQRTN